VQNHHHGAASPTDRTTDPADPLAGLRSATADRHRRLDARWARMAPALELDGYQRFLVGLARVVAPVETAINGVDATTDLDLDWPSRRKADLLDEDLATLGADRPPPLDAPPLTGPHPAMGALYVLEGSMLGGRVVARTVMDTLGPTAPVRYLRAYGDDAAARWAGYRHAARRWLDTPAALSEATATAVAVFDLFLQGQEQS
jgi:heme oxygenase (biliverdin-IX-beta and delta-forming)